MYLVDNASVDGTAEAVGERFGDAVTIIRNSSNLGFSRGNNVGIEAALDDGHDLILLLNNDTVVDPELVTRLALAMERSPGTGIAGPKINYFTPADRIWFAGGRVFLGEHGFFKKPPFLFEPLAMSTLIFSWPRGIVPGVVATPTHVCDVMPTVLDMVGARAIPSHGMSLLPLFNREGGGDRAVFCEFCEFGGVLR